MIILAIKHLLTALVTRRHVLLMHLAFILCIHYFISVTSCQRLSSIHVHIFCLLVRFIILFFFFLLLR
jgi:hypothetical protein